MGGFNYSACSIVSGGLFTNSSYSALLSKYVDVSNYILQYNDALSKILIFFQMITLLPDGKIKHSKDFDILDLYMTTVV